MQRSLSSVVALGVVALLALGAVAQAQEKKIDPTGKWTWTSPGRDGGPGRTNTLALKLEGAKLTGKMISPARGDQPARETEITEAKLTGADISFTVVREFNGNKMTSKYNGKISADTIKGKIEFERNGEAQSRDWEAKRVAAKK
jgi:hypothetical protein